jgi:hypothetical protein
MPEGKKGGPFEPPSKNLELETATCLVVRAGCLCFRLRLEVGDRDHIRLAHFAVDLCDLQIADQSDLAQRPDADPVHVELVPGQAVAR